MVEQLVGQLVELSDCRSVGLFSRWVDRSVVFPSVISICGCVGVPYVELSVCRLIGVAGDRPIGWPVGRSLDRSVGRHIGLPVSVCTVQCLISVERFCVSAFRLS